jgi:hypothetical protein
MLSFLLTYAIFNSSPVTTEDKRELGINLVTYCYKKIRSNFFYAHKCIRNNHTISEICGWIAGAWCCNDYKSFKKGYYLLEKEIVKQISEDGGYIQFSFNYHRLVLQMLECALVIGKKVNISMSNMVKKRIISSILQLYQLQDIETGFLPNYGPNDGALIFPITICDYCDFRPTLNAIYALIKGEKLYETGHFDEELLWFGRKNINDLPLTQIKKVSSKFDKSGLYSLRHNKGFLMVVLNNFKTRPNQMDQLHIDLWHKGKNILCDSGTYSYANDMGKQLELTGVHNTVKIDDKEQMKKYGPFLVYNWTKAKNIEFDQDYFRGTLVSKNGYLHTRCIRKVYDSYLIEDIISGDGNKCIFNFHTPCDVKITENGFDLIDNGYVIATVICTENINIERVYRSLYYLKTEDINRVSVCKEIENKRCNIILRIKLF